MDTIPEFRSKLRFWPHLAGSMARIAGVTIFLFGIGAPAFGIPLASQILIQILGVVLYLLGRQLVILARQSSEEPKTSDSG